MNDPLTKNVKHESVSLETFSDGTRTYIRAFLDGHAIGHAKIHHTFLDDVWVAEEFRHNGIGKRLVHAAVAAGALKTIAIAEEIRRIMDTLGWKTEDGRRYEKPTVSAEGTSSPSLR